MSNLGKRKGKTKMWIMIGVIVGGLSVVGGGAILADGPGRREIKELTISDVKFNNLCDGTFVGEYKGTKSHTRDTKVEITVSGGKISRIKILKGALDKDGTSVELRGGQTIDNLFHHAVESKTLQVDAISGATLTSKTHLKALEDALEQAQWKK